MSGKVEVKPGLFKETLKQGNPANPVRAGDSVTVHCTGVIAATGKKFWSTKDPGQTPFTFTAGVGAVISGWDNGCLAMCDKEEAVLYIPWHMGYGEQGFPAWGITPKADLNFTIEIISITRK